jgi:hypothetical protein
MVKIHIDADDAEIYTIVDPGDEKLSQSFIVEALTNALKLLNESNTKAVIFVVGKNLELNSAYQNLLKQFLEDGHVIGNHSYSHAEDFHMWRSAEQVQDVREADRIIRESLDCEPIHFRGPGYSSSHEIQEGLRKLGYLYDCTKIPLIYSSALDLYFKILKRGTKKIPSLLRFRDIYFTLSKPINGIEEQLIHPNKVWGIPIYSTWIFQNQKRTQNISKQLRNVKGPFLFHAIDFLDYYNPLSPIPTLRIPSSERFSLIKEICVELNKEPK